MEKPKNFICMTHGRELRVEGLLEGMGVPGKGGKFGTTVIV